MFDSVLDAVLDYLPEDKVNDVIWKIAQELWDGDWDCESDSKYYYLLLPMMHEAGMVDDDDYAYQLEEIPEARPPV